MLGRFRAGAPMRPWFLTIVANECRSARRARWWTVLRFRRSPRRSGTARRVGGSRRPWRGAGQARSAAPARSDALLPPRPADRRDREGARLFRGRGAPAGPSGDDQELLAVAPRIIGCMPV